MADDAGKTTGSYDFLFRISSEEEWKELQHDGSTFGSDFDRQTQFIHLCTQSQVEFVLANHFRPRTDLYLLKINPCKLGDGVVFECNDGVNSFPHFYGPSGSFAPLPVDCIVQAEKLEFVSAMIRD
eukprot:TRINITY_DN22675_c0_g1_i2.p1 TRINITY_DN22675_c0_g1~~TRINITY_DN22675_c0_g1_i2.p1  ORF type:complete len:126 (-),score=14.03 TRINITY_DN22675_c0_g1_i2:300-677(-)